MPTADRTTVRAALAALTERLEQELVASPPTASKPFRRVEVGAVGVNEHPRPFLSVLLASTKPVSSVDGDRIIEVRTTLRAVVDVTEPDTHETILGVVGAVEDVLDGLREEGLLDGAEGFDDSSWRVEYPKSAAGARIVVATAGLSFMVKVEREQNRVPAA